MNKSYFVIELLVFNFFFGIFFSQIHLSSKWESDSQNRFESWKTWNKHLLSLVNKVKSNKTRVEWSANCISVISAKCHSWANCCVNINEPINSNELQLLNDEFPFKFSRLILQYYAHVQKRGKSVMETTKSTGIYASKTKPYFAVQNNTFHFI